MKFLFCWSLTQSVSESISLLLTLQPQGRVACQLAWNRCSSLLTTGRYSRCTFYRGSKSLELGTLGCRPLARTSWNEILAGASETSTKMSAFSSTEYYCCPPSSSEIALNCFHLYHWLQHPLNCHLTSDFDATSYLKDFPYLVRDLSCVGGQGKAQCTFAATSAPQSYSRSVLDCAAWSWSESRPGWTCVSGWSQWFLGARF